MTMTQYRNETKMLDLFARIGWTFAPEVGAALFAEAARGYDMATINDFRLVATLYVDAIKNGREAEWKSQRGV